MVFIQYKQWIWIILICWSWGLINLFDASKGSQRRTGSAKNITKELHLDENLKISYSSTYSWMNFMFYCNKQFLVTAMDFPENLWRKITSNTTGWKPMRASISAIYQETYHTFCVLVNLWDRSWTVHWVCQTSIKSLPSKGYHVQI